MADGSLGGRDARLYFGAGGYRESCDAGGIACGGGFDIIKKARMRRLQTAFAPKNDVNGQTRSLYPGRQ